MTATELIQGDLEEVAEAKVDSKHRVTLKKIIVTAKHYRIYKNELGQIVLDPIDLVPRRERWLHRNKGAIASVKRGISDAKAQRLVDVDEDFTKFIDDDK